MSPDYRILLGGILFIVGLIVGFVLLGWWAAPCAGAGGGMTYTIHTIGKRDGWLVCDVLRDETVIASRVGFFYATTVIQNLIAPGDRYREMEYHRLTCDLSYTEIGAVWKQTARWDRGERE